MLSDEWSASESQPMSRYQVRSLAPFYILAAIVAGSQQPPAFTWYPLVELEVPLTFPCTYCRDWDFSCPHRICRGNICQNNASFTGKVRYMLLWHLIAYIRKCPNPIQKMQNDTLPIVLLTIYDNLFVSSLIKESSVNMVKCQFAGDYVKIQ